jgi:hypothetical protein
MAKDLSGLHGYPVRSDLFISVICSLLMVVIMLLDSAFPRGVAIDVLYIVPVLVSFRAQGKKQTLVVAAVCSLLVVMGYFISPPGVELWKAVFNRGLAITAVWITTILGLRNKETAARREEALRERAEALEDLKVLSGLLPICAWCKKVRNDQGYWTQIEAYISKHSEASFSHGICPECVEKFYPKVSRKKERGPEPSGEDNI